MRRTHAPESISVGNGRVERIVAEGRDGDVLRFTGPSCNPLVVDDSADVLRVMAMLIDYAKADSH